MCVLLLIKTPEVFLRSPCEGRSDGSPGSPPNSGRPTGPSMSKCLAICSHAPKKGSPGHRDALRHGVSRHELFVPRYLRCVNRLRSVSGGVRLPLLLFSFFSGQHALSERSNSISLILTLNRWPNKGRQRQVAPNYIRQCRKPDIPCGCSRYCMQCSQSSGSSPLRSPYWLSTWHRNLPIQTWSISICVK